MTTSPLSFQLSSLGPDDAAACADMTFPAYRHLLALTPALRLPAEPEQRPVTAFGVVARVAGVPVGLVLAEWPQQMESGPPEVLSLFVRASVRGHGLGRALLTAIAQDAIERRGASVLEAVYTTGKPSIPVLEHLFAQLGWDPPERRSLTVRFTPAEARATPWYGRTGLLPEGATIFPWAELTVAERHQLMTSNAAAAWIPNSLQPWRHDGVGFDPVSSVGLRYGGAVVGWVINHQVDARTVRFTCSFMRKDLSRRARILPLYSESIRRLSETSCELCTLITPTAYPGMTGFIHRHIAPYASFTGETRGTRTRGPSGAGR